MAKPTRVTNDIRRFRFEHGEMTQAELADRIGVTRQTIIAIEQGRYSPSLEMAFQIARVFGVPLDDVFHYSPEGDAAMTAAETRSAAPTPAALVHPVVLVGPSSRIPHHPRPPGTAKGQRRHRGGCSA